MTAPATQPSPKKNWVFTQNNIKIVPKFTDSVQYLVFQLEIAPETGHEHFQGFVQMKKKVRMTSMKQWLPEAHFEPMKGTAEQARDYCKKEESRAPNAVPYEFGEIVCERQRSDLLSLKREFEKPDFTNKVYAEEYFTQFARYPDLFTKYCRAVGRKIKQFPRDQFKLIVIWGKPGLGKSRIASALFPDAYHKSANKWWDNYTSEETVILDDFSGHYLSITDFKRLMDRYPLDVECKGSSIALQAQTYIITTNHLPDEWWKEEATLKHDMPAVYRRITEFWEFYSENKFRKFISTSQLSAYQAYEKSRTLTNAEKENSSLFTSETQNYEEI